MWGKTLKFLLFFATLLIFGVKTSYANSCWAYFHPVDLAHLQSQKRSTVERINTSNYDREYDGLISAELLPEFDTIRLFTATGRLGHNPQVRMLFTHGNGATYSNADAMRRPLRYFSDEAGTARASSNVTKIRQYPRFVKVASEAPDLPFHRFGSRNPSLRNYSAVTDYWIRYLKIMKSETPNIPLVVFTRSSSAVLFLNILEKEPGLIDAFILMSPTIPLNPDLVLQASNLLYEKAARGEFPINHEGLNWIDSILIQAHWDLSTLKKTPTLILTGKEDWEVVEIERDFLKQVAAINPNVTYVDIPGAGHDVLRETKTYKDRDILKTLMLIQDFLFSLTSKNQ